MKIYKIPIIYQCVDTFEIEADNLHDAVNNALDEFLSIPDDKYINDSFEIDPIIDSDYPDEEYDINVIIQSL